MSGGRTNGQRSGRDPPVGYRLPEEERALSRGAVAIYLRRVTLEYGEKISSFLTDRVRGAFAIAIPTCGGCSCRARLALKFSPTPTRAIWRALARRTAPTQGRLPCEPFRDQRLRPVGRVEDWRGGLRDWGVAVAGGFRPLPVPQSVP